MLQPDRQIRRRVWQPALSVKYIFLRDRLVGTIFLLFDFIRVFPIRVYHSF